MKIINHGTWQTYAPAKLPEAAPAGTLFTRRAGDGVDWYDYVNIGTHFAKDSVKLTVIDGVVGAATTDPTRLWPGNGVVLEVTEAPSGDPQRVFGEKIYDAAKQTFRDRPLPEVPDINELLKRIEALEHEKKGHD